MTSIKEPVFIKLKREDVATLQQILHRYKLYAAADEFAIEHTISENKLPQVAPAYLELIHKSQDLADELLQKLYTYIQENGKPGIFSNT